MTIPFIQPDVRPSVNELRLDLAHFFPELTHFYGYASGPDHNTKRCLDAMVYDSSGDYVGRQGRGNLPYAQRIALGDRILAFLRKNAEHYGLNGVVWNRKVYGFPHSDAPSGRNHYRGPYNVARPYTASAHDDHLHIDQDGSSFTPLRGNAKPVEGQVWIDLLVPGVTDSDSVRLVQKALGVTQTGAYDAATQAAVKAFQASLGDAPQHQDGLLGPKQAEALFEQKGINVEIRTDASGQAPKPPVVAKPPVVVKPDTPTPTKPEAPVTETVFGLNILRRTDTLAGRKRWPERKPLIGKILRDAKASVYLLNETDTQTRKDCGEALGSNFTWWGFKYYGIYWDQRVWERVGEATNQVELRDKNNRWLLSLPLRHKATGKVVTFDVTHLENDGDTKTDGHKARAQAAAHMADVAGRGNRVGFWDCNSTTPAIVSKPTPRELEKPRVILRNRIGARFLTSLGSSKVKNLSKGTHHGGKTKTTGPVIDDIWVVGDVQLLDGEVVLTYGTDASDHNGLKARIKV